MLKTVYFSIMKNLIKILSIFLISIPVLAQEKLPEIAAGKRPVVVIPVRGSVDPAMAAFISRAIHDATATYKDPLLIFEMDTFGGRVDAAFQIVDTLLFAPGDAQTIAFVRTKAISAGALIALAAGKLVMRPNTTIGDAAPISVGQDGAELLGEKIQSPLRAKFRTLAKRNGYPPSLAESMVTAGMIVTRVTFPDTVVYLDSVELAGLPTAEKRRIVSTETIVPAGELLTMDAAEAQDLGFAMMVVPDIDSMLTALDIGDHEVVRISESWSENFVKFIGTIAPILMMIGFGALYAELKSPGFGVFGLVGIICLALVFGGQYLVGLANYTELILIAIGVVLLGFELFVIPGFGIAGIFGIAFILAGTVLSFQDFVIPRPQSPWQLELFISNILMVLGSLVGSMVLALMFFKYVVPQMSRALSGPYLQETMAQCKIDPEIPLKISTGDEGVVMKTLRPSGSARIGDDIYDVITDGEYLDSGTRIVVTEARSNRIVVEKKADA
ncbi:MAG: NfeD family protein [Chitinivibrionales bacterium]